MATNSNSFDIAETQYRDLNQNPFDIAEKSLKEKVSFDTDEDLERQIERAQAQITSRIGELTFGLPGDLINLVGNLFGFSPNLSGSEKLREISESISGGYTKPQSEFEEKGGEIMQDIALFALPGAKTYSLARNIGIPIVANLAKEGLKFISGDEKKASYAKMGTMIALDLISHKKGLGGGAKEFAGNLFREAEEALPKGQSIKATGLENALNRLESTLTMGGERPSTKDALKKVSEIRSEIKNGKIDVKRLAAYRPSINELIDSFGGFELQLPKKIKAKAIKELNQVKGDVIKTLDDYGRNFNPKFGKLHTSANEAWAAYENSNKIANFLKKHVGKGLKSNSAKILLGIPGAGAAITSATMAPLATGTAALGAAGLTGIYTGIKLLSRMKNSTTLRTHYNNILTGALKGNATQVIKNAKALDKELAQEEENNPVE